MGGVLSEYKFRILLAALLCLILLFPAVDGTWAGRLTFSIALVAILLSGIWAAFSGAHLRLLALAAGAPAVLLPWLLHAWGVEGPSPALSHVLCAAFLGWMVVAIIRQAHVAEETTADGIAGALGAFLLIALLFGHLYSAVESCSPGSFLIQDKRAHGPENGTEGHFLLVYFSLCTQTTVGYGDIVPMKPLARSLAVIQALAGQFYLAVLIAGLVGKRLAQVTQAVKHRK
jgi:hypothetical protein